MAGVPGFEPGDGGIKTRCLTAWRYPIRDCIQSPSRQKIWLGYQDSNLGMAGSKPAALPLGDTPSGTVSSLHRDRKYGWGTRIRTWGWRDQNPLPYRLAIPHPGLYPVSIETENMAGVPGFEPGDGGIKTRCLTAWRYPIRDCIQSPSRQKIWLGYQDSNLGMAGSKPAALPLGDTPSDTSRVEMVRETRLELVHLAAPEPKSGASTNFATPAHLRNKEWWLRRDSNL